MELKDTLVTGATVLAVGTSSVVGGNQVMDLSLIHISEPTRPY